MLYRISFFASLLSILFLGSCKDQGPKRILIINEKAASSEGLTVEEILRQCSSKDILADTTFSYLYLSEDSLKNYHAVILNGVSPDKLNYRQQNDLERFVQAGAGVLVFDAYQDTVLNWPWYKTLTAERVSGQAETWKGKYDGGHVYFAKLDSKTRDEVAETINEALDFSINGIPDYSTARTERAPEENRFVMEVLDTYMYEPMEMVIFKDGRVLYLERRGDVKLYNPMDKKTKTIATFDVSITGNYEDGMLGVALDPDYDENHWIYINYSPAGDIPKQNVSRFEMIGDSLILASEKIVLEIPTQRETCCHSGGHLEFGPNGDLYISTGDNTSSKESDGFSPIDERPGRAPFDAQKSSGNTHDLRGKILRIHPEPDGTYTVPDGNLFPKDGSRGKPEIYVMGTRNAFRFTIDDHNGFVYWGDVGPDGGITNERGPESHDEFNQARTPGNYGWPYFVADNKAYADFDFATNKVGPRFNPDEPENTSPNNTGSKILPPAQKPMIWYPYGESKEFPLLGKGSRSAMSGPVYYYDDFKNAKTRFPKYFDGKLFIYEWARSWVKVVSFDEDVNLARIEPFLPGQEWYKPIDMKFGPDGALYVLQYGANYFEHNPDSRLVKITYVEGNREPKAELMADKTVGTVPLTVTLSAEKSFDFDRNDELQYTWDTGNGGNENSQGKKITVTYDKPGIYKPSVTVKDKEGKTASAAVEIRAGNEPPQISIELNGTNRSFYSSQGRIDYAVTVNDLEDGSLENGIDPSAIFLSFDYLKEGKDLALLASNAQMAGDITTLRGKTAIANSDCKTCHTIADKSIGPSYMEVAQRYDGKNAGKMLASKIIKGGNGNWGKNMMAAHPQHSEEEAAEMVKYILSLTDPQRKPLPLKGSVSTREHMKGNTTGFYVLRANYTDKGSPATGTLTGSSMVTLRHPKVEAEDADMNHNVSTRHIDGTDMTFLANIQDGSHIGFKNIDLTGIRDIHFKASTRQKGSVIEVRAGSAGGTLLGTAEVPQVEKLSDPVKPAKATLQQNGEQTDLYFIFRNTEGKKEDILFLDWIFFDNGTKVP
ncbi:MAG: PQQ-dependent sugar dehydrogenase [Chryseosolibacter sp.]